MADEFAGFDTSEIEIEDDTNVEQIDVVAPKFDVESVKTKINAVGRAEIGDEKEAYRFWVMKCLLTERYKYPAYSTDFGVEIEDIIQSDYPRDIAESEIQRTIVEALTVDERTISVDNFTFQWKGDSVWIAFEVESIYDTEIYELMRGGEEVGRVAIRAA